MQETTLTSECETFLEDPAFEPFRDALVGMVKTLESDTLCVFHWLKEGLEAGGQLAFISMLMAVADYDNEVHPRHILENLWHAYDSASDQACDAKPDGGWKSPADFRRARASARARRPELVGADAC